MSGDAGVLVVTTLVCFAREVFVLVCTWEADTPHPKLPSSDATPIELPWLSAPSAQGRVERLAKPITSPRPNAVRYAVMRARWHGDVRTWWVSRQSITGLAEGRTRWYLIPMMGFAKSSTHPAKSAGSPLSQRLSENHFTMYQCLLMRGMIKMFSLRRSFIASAVSILLLAVTTSEADSQSASNSPAKTAAEVATAIADASATTVFQSATSHDNFVEVQYKATDARLFPHNKAEGEQRRLRLTLNFCANPRIAPALRNGVVIHQVLVAPDNSDPFEFTIDQSSCTTILEDAAANMRERLESTRPTTEPNRVHTLTIRPNQVEEK
jgi:hypothetical protein